MSIDLYDCPHCKTRGMIPMPGNVCPNCKHQLNASIGVPEAEPDGRAAALPEAKLHNGAVAVPEGERDNRVAAVRGAKPDNETVAVPEEGAYIGIRYESLDAWREAQMRRVKNVEFRCPECKGVISIETACERCNTQFLSVRPGQAFGALGFIIGGLFVVAGAGGAFYYILLPILAEVRSKTDRTSPLFLIVAVIFIAVVGSMR